MTKRGSESGTDREYGKHLDQVRERSWIFERMRTVCVEEASTICPKLLDDLLRCNWPLGNCLFGDCIRDWVAGTVCYGLSVGTKSLHLHRLNQLHTVVGLQVLHDSLRNEHKRADEAKRQ